jgi:hypothetical protein
MSQLRKSSSAASQLFQQFSTDRLIQEPTDVRVSDVLERADL